MWHRGERPAGDPAWKENGPTALSSSRPARTRLPTSSLRHIHGRENVVRRFREFYAVFSHDFRRVSLVADQQRSEEHTSELQSLMRSSYAVFCLKKKIDTHKYKTTHALIVYIEPPQQHI